MRQKAGLNRSVLDAGLGEFRRQLECKARHYGRTLIVVDRWYPGSKTCSHCGHVLDTLSLGTRRWTCPSCRARHDRDLNAAKNIGAAGRVAARERLPGGAWAPLGPAGPPLCEYAGLAELAQ
ncbi:RNA-guided endonuclease InsQ/TnpB family protein [Streptomonospora salina]|uniref:Transposase n=1 Tax=Streptomonospora salina TaxID=104205 RepID=A0A841E6H5_9ACTN|nr:transposase [Streptomonospora salina]MBB5996909.1 transposase [Streptomonospora salina]